MATAAPRHNNALTAFIESAERSKQIGAVADKGQWTDTGRWRTRRARWLIRQRTNWRAYAAGQDGCHGRGFELRSRPFDQECGVLVATDEGRAAARAIWFGGGSARKLAVALVVTTAPWHSERPALRARVHHRRDHTRRDQDGDKDPRQTAVHNAHASIPQLCHHEQDGHFVCRQGGLSGIRTSCPVGVRYSDKLSGGCPVFGPRHDLRT